MLTNSHQPEASTPNKTNVKSKTFQQKSWRLHNWGVFPVNQTAHYSKIFTKKIFTSHLAAAHRWVWIKKASQAVCTKPESGNSNSCQLRRRFDVFNGSEFREPHWQLKGEEAQKDILRNFSRRKTKRYARFKKPIFFIQRWFGFHPSFTTVLANVWVKIVVIFEILKPPARTWLCISWNERLGCLHHFKSSNIGNNLDNTSTP